MAKVITIAQQKGGAGKTTIAVHLAVALSQKGNRVAAIDIDPQGSMTHWHGVREKMFGEGYTGLTFSSLSGWRVGSEVSRLRRSHDFIIIDSPPHTQTEARTAIRNADLVVIPVQPSPTDLWATKPTYDLAKAERVPVRIVLNRAPHNSKLAHAVAAELPDLLDTTIGSRVLFASSLFEGRSATEVDPASSAAYEIKQLVKEILTIFKSIDAEEDEAPTRSSSRQRELEPA